MKFRNQYLVFSIFLIFFQCSEFISEPDDSYYLGSKLKKVPYLELSKDFWSSFKKEGYDIFTADLSMPLKPKDQYCLEFDRQPIDRIEVYLLDSKNQSFYFGKSGRAYSFADKEYPSAIPKFPILIPENYSGNLTLLLVVHHHGLLVLNPRFYPWESFVSESRNYSLIHGLNYGIFLIFMVIGFFYYKNTKEKIYLFFGFYVFLYILSHSTYNGIFTDLLLLDNFEWIRRLPFLTYMTLVFFQFAMILSYFERETKSKKPKYFIVLGILFPIIVLYFQYGTFITLSPAVLVLTILSQLFVFYLFVQWSIKTKAINFFLLGRLMLFLSFGLWMMFIFAVLKDKAGFRLRSLGEVVLFFDAALFVFAMRKDFETIILEKEDLKKQLDYNIEKMQFVSHQLKSPLSNMKIGFSLLKSKSLPDTERISILKSLEKGVGHALAFAERISWKHRLQEKFYPLQLQKVTLKELIEDCWENVNYLANDKVLHLSMDLSEDYHLRTDPVLFKEVIKNILANSLEASQEQGKIQISLENNTLCIEDQGKGMSAEQLESIQKGKQWIDFERADSSGLGLTIVREACLLLGIRFHLESELGIGTKVFLVLS